MSSTSPSRQQHLRQHHDDTYADEGDDLLADYFEKSALAVRHIFTRYVSQISAKGETGWVRCNHANTLTLYCLAQV